MDNKKVIGNPVATTMPFLKLLQTKIDKEEGKGLSTNDFTNEHKQKLDSLTEGGGGKIPEKISDLIDDTTAYDFKIKYSKSAEFAEEAGCDSEGRIFQDFYATKEKVAEVEAIAKGRATGYVFDTIEDMFMWLDERNASKLNLGDNLYIRQTEVPDYWWDGSRPSMLETDKVDLSGYATLEDLSAAIGEALEGDY